MIKDTKIDFNNRFKSDLLCFAFIDVVTLVICVLIYLIVSLKTYLFLLTNCQISELRISIL